MWIKEKKNIQPSRNVLQALCVISSGHHCSQRICYMAKQNIPPSISKVHVIFLFRF
jgi:hypothetical protein